MVLNKVKYIVFGDRMRVHRWDGRGSSFFAWHRLWLMKLALLLFFIGVGKSAFCEFPREVFNENTLGQFVSVLEDLSGACATSGESHEIAWLEGVYNMTSTVTIPPGLSITLVGSGEMTIIDGLLNYTAAVNALFSSDSPQLQGGKATRPFIVSMGATLGLQNLTVRGGGYNGLGGGGAVNVIGGTLLGSRVSFVGNSVTPISASFQDIQALRGGGAVQVEHGGTFECLDCIFLNNAVERDDIFDIGYGGAVNVIENSSLLLYRCTISHNSATTNGGGIYLDGSHLNFTDTMFELNYISTTRGFGGGAIGGSISRIGIPSIINGTRSRFISNTAEKMGGGIYVDFCDASFSQCTFVGNRIISGDGGAIAVLGGKAELLYSNFTHNRAEDFRGGGIMVGNRIGGSRAILKGCYITHNYAAREGGGILAAPDSTVIIENSIVSRNSAWKGGGLASLASVQSGNGNVVSLSQSIFKENVAGSQGGAMYALDNTDMVISELLVESNHAVSGGAISFSSALAERSNGTITIADSTFLSNSAIMGGPGLLIQFVAKLAMKSVNFINQTSVAAIPTITMTDSSATALEVQFIAGDSYMSAAFETADSNSSIFCEQCIFSGYSGPQIVVSKGKLVLNEADFTNSTSLVAVNAASASQPAWVRNALVGTSMFEASDYEAGFSFGLNVGNCTSLSPYTTNFPCLSGCKPTTLGISCKSYIAAVSGEVLDMVDTKLLLSAESTSDEFLFPMHPDVQLNLTSEGVNGGKTFWEVEVGFNSTINHPVEWEVTPARGVIKTGSTISLHAMGSYPGADATTLETLNGGSVVNFVAQPEIGEMDDVNLEIVWHLCGIETFWNGTECLSCIDGIDGDSDGVDCRKPGSTLRSLPLEEDYWRALLNSTMVRKCWLGNACVGASEINSSDEYCGDAYSGPYCTVCKKGYVSGTGKHCIKCNESISAAALTSLLIISIAALAFLAAVIYTLMGWEEVDNEAARHVVSGRFGPLRNVCDSWFNKINWDAVRLDKLRMPVITMQIMTQFAKIARIDFPDEFGKFLNIIGMCIWGIVASLTQKKMNPNRIILSSLILGNPTVIYSTLIWKPFYLPSSPYNYKRLGWIFAAGCIEDFDFYQRFLFATLAPIATGALLFISYSVAQRRHQRIRLKGVRKLPPPDAVEASLLSKHFMALTVILFLVYSSVSSIVLQMFECDSIEVGTFLVADYSISCNTAKHRAYMVFAIFMILVYPIGIPIFFFGLIFKDIKAVKIEVQKLEEERLSRKKYSSAMQRFSITRSGSEQHHAGSARYRRTLSASTLRTVSASILQMNGGGSYKGSESPNLETNNTQFKSSRPVSVSGHRRAPLHSIQHQQSGTQNSLKEFDDDVNDGAVTEKKEENIWAERMHTYRSKPTKFLWRDYKKNRWYYEMIEFARRLLLTSVLVLIPPGSVSQVATACLVSVAALVINAYLVPFSSSADSRIYLLGAFVIFMTTFYGLVIRAHSGNNYVDKAYGRVIIAFTIILILSAIVQFIYTTYKAFGAGKDMIIYAHPSFISKASKSDSGSSLDVLEEANPKDNATMSFAENATTRQGSNK